MMEPITNASDAAEAERTEARRERFGDHQREPEHHQSETRIVHRENLECVQREQQCDRADDARQNRAGVVALEQQTVDADQHEQIRDVRIREDGEQRVRQSVSTRSITSAVRASVTSPAPSFTNPPPIDLSQQIRDIRRDDVDDVLLQRCRCGQSSAAERTADSAHSALRLRSSASPRM